MTVDALKLIYLRNRYYRQGQRRMLIVFFIGLVSNLMLASILLYLILYPPAPVYFPVSINGRIIPMFSLNVPNQSAQNVLQWTTQATIAAFSYSYVNYRDELQASSGFFTAGGWQKFLDALDVSNNLEAIKNKQFIVSSELIPGNLPTIKKQGIKNGFYFWEVQVPILVTYQNNLEYTQQYNKVDILVSRVLTLNAPRGVGIAQFVVSPIM